MSCPVRLVLLAVLAASSTIMAQQFQDQVGAVPGPLVWSESCEAFDANGDGWLDIIVCNGKGFSSAQGALAPTLLINQAMTGQAVFADETATRLPTGFIQQGKGTTVCDVDLDGDEDLLFANAFGNQPRILINDGTGVFTDETSTRLPIMLLNSYGVNWGDLDDDGDIDLVFNDNGGAARLLLNDGSGVFSDNPAKMNAVVKAGAMQVNLVDIDNDFDLDVIVDGKSVGQQLYLNDGSANFIYAGSSALPGGSNLTYETDWADLDNDNDLDGVYVSMSGFNEGVARNNLVGQGSLTFQSSTSVLTGLNGQDDNEVAYLDANNDGYLDVLFASLGNNREKLYLSTPPLAAGSLVYQSNGFTGVTDSTLDLCIGDFDQDGAYDIFTAQGESGSFLNRLYLNTGPADTIAPRIGRVETLPALVPIDDLAAGALKLRAFIQDATYDSGRNFITAQVAVTTTKGAFSATTTYAMQAVGGGLWSAVILPLVPPDGLLGATIDVSVIADDPQLNSSTSAPQSFVVDGVESYDPASLAAGTLSQSWAPDGGLPLAITGTIAVTGATPGGLGLFGASLAAVELPISGVPLLIAIDPVNLVLSGGFGYGFAGELNLPSVSRSSPFIAGTIIHLQFFETSPIPAASNGLRMRMTP